jgi:hypothetical protein
MATRHDRFNRSSLSRRQHNTRSRHFQRSFIFLHSDLRLDDETARLNRVKQLASLLDDLDDLDASAKSSRIRPTELLHSRSRSSSPPDSPSHSVYTQSQQSTIPSQFPGKSTRRQDLSDIREHSEDDDEMLSDLDEMINNVPSDEEPDPNMSPAPTQSTPYIRDTERSKSKSIGRDMFQRNDISPVRGLKSAQKTNNKTPAKTVDFKDTSVPSPL